MWHCASRRRFVVLGGPRGETTVLAAGSYLLENGPRRGWTRLAIVNLPRRLVPTDGTLWARKDVMREAALRVWGYR